MQQTLTVSIGRAIPGTERILGLEAWFDFRRKTRLAVETYAEQILFTGSGTGYWTEDGTTITEDSYTIVALFDPAKPVYRLDEDDTTYGVCLRERLTAIRDYYFQTAAAFTLGSTDLI